VGRSTAHALVEEASRRAIAEKKYLADVLVSDARITAHISAGEMGKLFDPLSYVGVAGQFVDRVLAAKHAGDSEKGD